jgi:hypothetical protein
MKVDAVSQRFTYRVFEESDLSGVLKLWEEAGWGSLTPDTWRQWFQETPYGPSLVVVASDGQQEIVAQEVFTPSEVLVAGRTLQALRISAPILSPRLRGRPIRDRHHPVVQLLFLGAELAAGHGYELIYAQPDRAWLPFLRWVSRLEDSPLVFERVQYGCSTLRLEGVPVIHGQNWRVAPELEYGHEFDALWQAAVERFPIGCAVVRKAEWVRYKNRGHITLAMRNEHDGRLIGYAATRRRDGLMVDAFAASPDDLHNVVAATVEWLTEHGRDGQSAGVRELKIMESSVFHPIVQILGFERVPFNFAFACAPLGSRSASIPPDRWFITPGD